MLFKLQATLEVVVATLNTSSRPGCRSEIFRKHNQESQHRSAILILFFFQPEAKAENECLFGVCSSFTFENISTKVVKWLHMVLRDSVIFLPRPGRRSRPLMHTSVILICCSYYLILSKLIRTTRGSVRPECQKRLARWFDLNVLEKKGKLDAPFQSLFAQQNCRSYASVFQPDLLWLYEPKWKELTFF